LISVPGQERVNFSFALLAFHVADGEPPSRNVVISMFLSVYECRKNIFSTLTFFFVPLNHFATFNLQSGVRFAKVNREILTFQSVFDAHWISANLMMTYPPMSLSV
jgi:hypothetical protein